MVQPRSELRNDYLGNYGKVVVNACSAEFCEGSFRVGVQSRLGFQLIFSCSQPHYGLLASGEFIKLIGSGTRVTKSADVR